MDFYCQHLLSQVQFDDGRVYDDNDISTLDYDKVLHNAKEFGISKASFLSAVKYDSEECKFSINLDALWKLSILIWHWKALHPVLMPEIKDVDRYVKFASLLKAGLDVESITITGKLPNKSKRTKITLSSDEVISVFLDALFKRSFTEKMMADDNIKHYTVGKVLLTYDVLDMRTIAYQIARELTHFFCRFRDKKRLDGSTKSLIMSILGVFSLAPVGSNNNEYNKLFSDARKGRLPICDHFYQPTIIRDFGILDYTIVKSPESI